MSAYCTTRQVYELGIERGSLRNPGRVVQSVSNATDAIDLADHGFAEGDPVTFRAGNAGSLPSPLASGTTYYVIVRSASRFSVSATPGGSAVDFSSTGSNVVVVAPLPVETAIEWGSAMVDEMTPDHLHPFNEPYPIVVQLATAELAAAKLGRFVREDAKSLPEVSTIVQGMLAKWAKGVPVTRASTSGRAARSAVASATLGDSSGYRRFGGIR